MSERPIVAMTMGDPAGVGPEVAAKALAREEVWDCCRPLLVGDVRVMAKAIELVGVPLALHTIASTSDARFDPTAPDVLDLRNADPDTLPPGQVSAAAGRASVDYVEQAVALAQAGQADAIATGPIDAHPQMDQEAGVGLDAVAVPVGGAVGILRRGDLVHTVEGARFQLGHADLPSQLMVGHAAP